MVTGGLHVWTVTENPSDYPGKFVARLWIGMDATDTVLIEEDLKALRGRLARRGLYRLDRRDGDDPVIVETWL